MRQQYGLLCLLLVFISGYQAQDPTPAPPEWNGDPQVCVVNPPPTPPPGVQPPFPKFTTKAEFALERVETKYVFNQTLPSEMTLYEYIYDYDANKLIMVKNKNGFIDVEYYYYNILKKSTYYAGQYCVVSDIPQNIDLDGASAIQINGTGHVRPLNEFLLFSSNDTSRLVTPVYLGNGSNRGIPVDKWQSCHIDRANYRTVRREWSFARPGITTSVGPVGEYAVPVHASIRSSQDFPNGTQIAEVDEVFNVLSYRPYILETATALSPPKGVFCSSGPGQELISLRNASIEWPNRFSVRVEASTSRTTEWQRFHLRYDSGRDGGSRRLRYDYMPPGAEDYHTVIHDYGNDLTYSIDRRVGSCRIRSGIRLPNVNPVIDPIRFFVENEERFIYNPPENKWEYNGIRACRGNSITCAILTSSVDNFPDLIDIDTGKPTGEAWGATNIEYAWSRRSPFTRPPRFDYPVSIFLKLFRSSDPNNPSPLNIRTEDIEYEFYEMSHERHPYDFDTSICYRSLNYEYLHLVFTLKLNRGDVIDSNTLDRRDLERRMFSVLSDRTKISFSRLSGLEIDHERVSNDVTVFITLLGPTPKPDSPTGFADEIKASDARDNLQRAIDGGQLYFDLTLEDNTTVQFRAEPGSLKSSKQYMSTHAAGRAIVVESYTSGSQALAVIVGLIIGIVVGAVLAAVFRIVRKEPMPPMPKLPTSISNPLPSIKFDAKKSNGASSKATSDA